MTPFGSKHMKGRGKGGKNAKLSITRSGNIRKTNDPQSPGNSSSSDEEVRKVHRPAKDKTLLITKEEFYEHMVMICHPILREEDKLEKAYRCIDLANSMMEKNAEEKLDQEMADMQEGRARNTDKDKTGKEGGAAFFQDDMSTTIMMNGVDQIADKLRSPTWGKAIWDLYRGTGVSVQDVWPVKKENNKVVSALVKFSSRYQKTAAISIVNEIRADIAHGLSNKARVRVGARDAFPREQMSKVQEYYTRGHELKKAGKIQSYRIYNTGIGEPTFEVRTNTGGKSTWGLAQALNDASQQQNVAEHGDQGVADIHEGGKQQQRELEDEIHRDHEMSDSN
jgi:hypothetical protein